MAGGFPAHWDSVEMGQMAALFILGKHDVDMDFGYDSYTQKADSVCVGMRLWEKGVKRVGYLFTDQIQGTYKVTAVHSCVGRSLHGPVYKGSWKHV